MIIPYGTDAPIYHWPFATVGIILVNLLIHVQLMLLPEERAETIYEWFILRYGWWNPLQWITSNYLHGNIVHVVGNMIVLWGIGIVVEGKLGWWRFLLLYNAIGIFQCGVEQTLMLFAGEGGSLGASAIIFGLLAIAMVWAPSNELNCFAMWGYYFSTFEMSILNYASFSLGIELLLGAFQVFGAALSDQSVLVALSSQVLHLMGAGVGFGLGVFMLRHKWVDCENWDLFSVLKERHRLSRDQLAEEALNSPEAQAKREQLQAFMHEQLHNYVAAGEFAAALAVHRRGTTQFDGWRLAEADHVQLISLLRKAERWDDAVQVMVEYLKMDGARAAVVRLALAQVLADKLGRPLQAVKVLARLDPTQLPSGQQPTFAALQERATRAAEDDPFEVVNSDW